jgi:hypothetical protein
VDRHQIGLRDHLDEIGAAPAHPAVGDADHGNAVRRGLGDRRLGGMVHRHHADIVATVVKRRDGGLVQDAHRAARQREAVVLGDVEKLGEAGIFIAAQGGVDHVIADDPRLLRVISDAAQGALAKRPGVVDAEMNSIGRHDCSPGHFHGQG